MKDFSLTWSKRQLGELISIKTGKLDSNAAVSDGLYPFFTCSQETFRTNTFAFDTECVLLAGNNANGIYPLKYYSGKFDAYQRTYVLRSADENILLNRFLYFALRLQLELLQSLSTGAATKFLTLGILKDITLNLPSIDVQHKIAATLSAYDDLIENNTRRIKLLEEMAQAIYREWFVEFRAPGVELRKATAEEQKLTGKDVFPKEWEVGIINDLLSIQSGFAFKSGTFVENGKYGLVTIRNVQDGLFETECTSRLDDVPPKVPQYCYLATGDILLSLTGNIGRVCLVYGKDYLLNQRVAKLAPKEETGRAFVYCMFRQRELQTSLEKIANGVAQQNLSPIETGKLAFIVPSDEALAAYAEMWEPLVDSMLVLYQKNANLRQTRDLLLPKLISGEVDVEGIEITP